MRLCIAVLATMLPTTAMAQNMPCGDPAKIIGHLVGKYGERPVGAGIMSGTDPMMIYANPKTGTFSIVVRRSNGMACLVMGGTGYAVLDPGKEPTDGQDL